MNLIKKTLFFLFTLITLTIFVLWVFFQYINPNSVKDILNQQLTNITAQKSRIDGKISWHIIPSPRLRVSNIKIGETNGPTSILIDTLSFNLEIKPLLRGRLVFNELDVDGFNINTNLEAKPLIKINNVSKKFVQPSTIPRHTSWQFEINSALLKRGTISFSHGQEKTLITDLQVGATLLNLHNELFPIQVKAKLFVSSPAHKLNANFNFKGRTRLANSLITQPLIALQNSGLTGQLIIEPLQFNHLKITKINANVGAKAGELILNPMSLSLYNGESLGDLQYEFKSKKLSINQVATGLNANQLAKTLLGSDDLQGNLDFSIHATANLQETNWQNNLHGNGNLTIKNGVLNFIDFNQVIDDLSNKINTLLSQHKFDLNFALQTLYPTKYQEGKTKFELFKIQYNLQNALLLNDTFLLRTNRFSLDGNGQVHLNDYSINNDLSVKLLTPNQKIANIQQLLDGSFPFRLNGTLTSPILLPNVHKINPYLASYLLKKTLDKPVKQLKATLKNLFKELS